MQYSAMPPSELLSKITDNKKPRNLLRGLCYIEFVDSTFIQHNMPRDQYSHPWD
jgi:hypothetical protein